MKVQKQRTAPEVSFGSDEYASDEASPRWNQNQNQNQPASLHPSYRSQDVHITSTSSFQRTNSAKKPQYVNEDTLGPVENFQESSRDLLFSSAHSQSQGQEKEKNWNQEQILPEPKLATGPYDNYQKMSNRYEQNDTSDGNSKFFSARENNYPGDQVTSETEYELIENKIQHRQYDETPNENQDGLLEAAHARHIDGVLSGFMERLFMREKLAGMFETLQQVESRVLTVLANENNENCDAIVQSHVHAQQADHNNQQHFRSCLDAFNGTNSIIERLDTTMKAYCFEKFEIESFGQMVYHSANSQSQSQNVSSYRSQNRRYDSGDAKNSFTLMAGQEQQTLTSSDQEQIAFVNQKNHKRISEIQTACDQQAHFMDKRNDISSMIFQQSTPTEFLTGRLPPSNNSDFSNQVMRPVASADPNDQLRPEAPLMYHPHNHQRILINQSSEQFQSPVAAHRNPFQEQQAVSSDQSSTPIGLNVEELRICNDLIEKLKADCEIKEQAILMQQNEIASLKGSLKVAQRGGSSSDSAENRELRSLVSRLSEEVKDTRHENNELFNEAQQNEESLQRLQDQLKYAKGQLNLFDERKGQEIQRVEAGKNNQLEGLRTDYEYLQKRYQELKRECEQKEEQVEEVQAQAKEMLQQAQDDATECISYFKRLAVNSQGQSQKMDTVSQGTNEIPSKVTRFSGVDQPQSLAPKPILRHRTINDDSQENINSQLPHKPEHRISRFSDTFGRAKNNRTTEIPRRSLTQPHSYTRANSADSNRDPISRILPHLKQQQIDVSDEQPSARTRTSANHQGMSERISIALDSLVKAYDEITTLKSSIHLLTSRATDAYSDQIGHFSVLAYDFLNRIDCFARHEQNIESKLAEQKGRVERLKGVLQQSGLHIKYQQELLKQQKIQLEKKSELLAKFAKVKNRERQQLARLCTDEFSLLGKTVAQSTETAQIAQQKQADMEKGLEQSQKTLEVTKKKLQILEKELENSLLNEQKGQDDLTTEKEKLDRLNGIIQDIWTAEIEPLQKEGLQSETNTLRSSQRAIPDKKYLHSQKEIPMPITWLSDLHDFIHRMKESENVGREECYAYLEILNKEVVPVLDQTPAVEVLSAADTLSERAQSYANQQHDHAFADPSSLYYAGSQRPADGYIIDSSKSLRAHEEYYQNEDTSSQDDDTDDTAKEISFSHRCVADEQSGLRLRGQTPFVRVETDRVQSPQTPSLSEYMHQRHQIEKQQQPYVSRALNGRVFDSFGPTVDQTKRTVQFSDIAQQRRVYSHTNLPEQRGDTQSLPMEGSKKILVKKRPENTKQLYSVLRNELSRVANETRVRKETIFQMCNEMKALKESLNNQMDYGQQAFDEKIQLESHCQELASNFQEEEQKSAQIIEVLRTKEEQNEQLQSQIGDFERDLIGLQEQMTNIMKLNAEISAASEHWEGEHGRLKQDLERERGLAKDNFESLADAHNEQIAAYKKSMEEKDGIIEENCRMLEREREFRTYVEIRRKNVCHVETNTKPDLELTERENIDLKDQLKSVKSDITAVLDQYEDETSKAHDFEISLNRQREINSNLVKEVHELQNNRTEMFEAFEKEKQEQEERIEHEQTVNEDLQKQVQIVSHLTEDLQRQVNGTSVANNELQGVLNKREEEITDMKSQMISYEFKLQNKDKYIGELKYETQDLGLQQQPLSYEEHLMLPEQQRSISQTRAMNHRSHQIDYCSSGRGTTMSTQRARSHNLRESCHKQQMQANFNGQVIRLDESALTNYHHKSDLNTCGTNTQEKSFIVGANDSLCQCGRPVPDKLHTIQESEHNFQSTGAENYNQQNTSNSRTQTLAHSPAAEKHMRSYKELKIRSEMTAQAKKKVRRVTKYLEDLVNYYVGQINDSQNFSASVTGLFGTQEQQLAMERDCYKSQRTRNERTERVHQTQKQVMLKMKDSQAHFRASSSPVITTPGTQYESEPPMMDTVPVCDGDQFVEARAYFARRCPKVISGLKMLVQSAQTKPKGFHDKNVQSACSQTSRTSIEGRDYPPQPKSMTHRADNGFQQFGADRTNSSAGLTTTENESYQKRQDSFANENFAILAKGGIPLGRDTKKQLANKQFNQLMQSYLETGRNLAGICYGGCMLMQSDDQRTQVDRAMKFLSQDVTLLQEKFTNKQEMKLQDTVEILLTCLSQIITKACQQLMKETSQPPQEQSIWRKSINLSDQPTNQSMANLPKDQPPPHSVRVKLMEVEKNLRAKFSHVQKLESALESTLGLSKHGNPSSSPQQHETDSTATLNSHAPNNKLLNSILRVIRKLKIELHSDYLMLGQVNMFYMNGHSDHSPQLSTSRNSITYKNSDQVTPKPRNYDAANNPYHQVFQQWTRRDNEETQYHHESALANSILEDEQCSMTTTRSRLEPDDSSLISSSRQYHRSSSRGMVQQHQQQHEAPHHQPSRSTLNYSIPSSQSRHQSRQKAHHKQGLRKIVEELQYLTFEGNQVLQGDLQE